MDKKDIQKILLSFKTFKKYSIVFSCLSADFKSIKLEYKAFTCFLETVTKSEADEFFENGYITIGDWRLYHDLTIGPKNSKKERQRLSCTDGRGWDLPHFDRIVQKYLYLKNDPDNIIRLGKRHLRRNIGLEGSYIPTNFDTLAIDYSEISKERKRHLFDDRPHIRRFKVSNMPNWVYYIFKLDSSDYKLSKKRSCVIIENVGLILESGGLLSPNANKRARYFRHFYVDKTKRKVISSGFKWKEVYGETVLDILDKNKTLRAQDISRLTQSKSSSIRDLLLLPGYVNTSFLQSWTTSNIWEKIDYYKKHSEFRYTFENKRKVHRKRFTNIWEDNTADIHAITEIEDTLTTESELMAEMEEDL